MPAHVRFWLTNCSWLRRPDNGLSDCAMAVSALAWFTLGSNRSLFFPGHLSVTATSLRATQSQLNHRSTQTASPASTPRRWEQTWQPRGGDVRLLQERVTNIYHWDQVSERSVRETDCLYNCGRKKRKEEWGERLKKRRRGGGVMIPLACQWGTGRVDVKVTPTGLWPKCLPRIPWASALDKCIMLASSYQGNGLTGCQSHTAASYRAHIYLS